jgi:hypothetical protein
MDTALPLILLFMSIILTVGGSSAAHSDFPKASSIVAYVFAAILGIIGAGILVYRRRQEGGVGSWASVFVGPDSNGIVRDLFSHGLWILLLLFTIIATVFITSAFPSTSPLAWIGYVIIGVLSLMTLFMSPVVSGNGDFFTSPTVIGAIIISLVLIAILILGAAYPIVGWSVLGGLAMLTVYYIYRNWTPTMVRWSKTIAKWIGLRGQPLDDIDNQIAKVKKLAGSSNTTNTLVGTVVVSGLIIALAVYLPTIWRNWPSLRIGGNLGTILIPGPLSLATSESVEIGTMGWTGKGGIGWGTSQGTSEYTITWWQFMNARAQGEAATALELGPVGQLLIGPGPLSATLALTTPAPQGAIEKVHIKVTPQRWQHVAVRASGDRTDVFLDGKLVGSSLRPPSSVRPGDILTMPGNVPRDTLGGIASLTFSHQAEPFSALVLAANTPPPE